MAGVTDNVSTLEASAVTCYGCENNSNDVTSRDWLLGGLHCITCHGSHHRACAQCGECLPKHHRWDRFYCSSTCRVTAKRERERAAFERAAWEAEHPEEAAREHAEFEEWKREMQALTLAAGLGERPWDARERALKERADRCAATIYHPDGTNGGRPTPCNRPFSDGEVIYRRHRELLQSRILPYCEDHACSQPSGRHNRDAPEGQYYPACSCPDDRRGMSKWMKTEPCAGCGRLVRNHRDAAPTRFMRAWMTDGEARARREAMAQLTPDERWEVGREWPWAPVPRIYCSDRCKRIVSRTETKVKRAAARIEFARCSGCHREFRLGRQDSRYCSNACRQRAYRTRRAQ